MKYGRKEYLEDCKNPEMPHIKDGERFKQFYEELGRDPVQKAQQVVNKRIAFIKPKGYIIELGCHAGFNCILWGNRGHICKGIDISATLIDEANKRLKKENKSVQKRVSFECVDIVDLWERHQYWDTVVLTETLEHVIDPLPILKKAKYLLSPHGKIYISAPSVRIGTYSHVRGVTESDLIKWGEIVGLKMQFIPDLFPGQYVTTQAIASHV